MKILAVLMLVMSLVACGKREDRPQVQFKEVEEKVLSDGTICLIVIGSWGTVDKVECDWKNKVTN